MRRDVFVYIAGPMTARGAKSVEHHTATAVAMFMKLIREGIPAFCPHLTTAYPSAWTVFDYGIWLDYDIAILDRCTHVVMLPGWQKSKGARAEHQHAVDNNKPVAYDYGELLRMLHRV